MARVHGSGAFANVRGLSTATIRRRVLRRARALVSYVEAGHTLRETCAEFGVSLATVGRDLRRVRGARPRSFGPGAIGGRAGIPQADVRAARMRRAKLAVAYVDGGRSPVETAALLGVNVETVRGDLRLMRRLRATSDLTGVPGGG